MHDYFCRLNTTMQNFMFTMLKDSHKIAAKTSLDVMIELYRKNADLSLVNPSRMIHSLCADDFFQPGASCRSKAYYCKKSVSLASDYPITHLQKYAEWEKSSIITIDEGLRLSGVCHRPSRIKLSFHPKHKMFKCSGASFAEKRKQNYCKKIIGCLILMHGFARKYERDVAQCRERAKALSQEYSYGFYPRGQGRRRSTYEYLKAAIDLPGFPLHTVRSCSNKYSRFTLRSVIQNGSRMVECRRKSRDTIALKERVANCFEFIAECKAMIGCAVQTSPCRDSLIGNETTLGFVTELNSTFDTDLERCFHFGVSLVKVDDTIYCQARGNFKYANKEFCPSYAETCARMVRCAHGEVPRCRFTKSGKVVQSPMYENLVFDYPAPVDSNDPRYLMPIVYQCNRKHGYPHKIHLYFFLQN